MNKKNNNRTYILLIVLVGLLVVMYKVMFMDSSSVTMDTVQNSEASARVEELTLRVNSISFDTEVLQDAKFQSLKSIATPLVSLPIGKKNPFSAN